ncbi:MAG: hypothetical protein JSS82_00430 [Bacteroidetes bacterium]|nr:hypothetical protein [Bacteroidota bacterium]
MRITIGILFSTLCFVSIMSCSTKKQDTKYYHLPDGLLDYFDYQDGTYWLFRDSLTGDNDSLIATNYRTAKEGPENGLSWDKINVTLIDYHITTGQKDTFVMSLSSEGDLDFCDLYDNQQHLRLYGNLTYRYPFFETSGAVERKNFTSLFTNNNSYANPYRYYWQIDNDHFDEIIINHDSGFIRIGFNDSAAHRILQLHHSHIIRSH